MAKQVVVSIRNKPHIWSYDDSEYLPVEDAITFLYLELVERILRYAVRNGDSRNSAWCVYAVALRRQKMVPIIDVRVLVNFTYLRFPDNPGVWIRYSNPNRVREFIRSYDPKGAATLLGGTFSLELRPPALSDRKNNEELGYKKGKSGTKSKKKRNSPSGYVRNNGRQLNPEVEKA